MTAVSILMAAYNHEDYVGAAIESVLAQTFQDWELIVVDDCSTDRTWEVIQTFADPRIRATRLSTNTRACGAYNHALALAGGSVVMTLDSDDQYLPDKVARQAEYLGAHPEVDVVGTYVTTQPASPDVEAWFNQSADLSDPANWIWANRLAHSSVAVRRSRYEQSGGLREDLTLIPDWELWLRLIREEARIEVIPEQLTVIRVSPTGVTHSDPVGSVAEYLSVSVEYWQDLLAHHSAAASTENLRIALEEYAGLSDSGKDRVTPMLESLLRQTPDSLSECLALIRRQTRDLADRDAALSAQALMIEARGQHLEEAGRELAGRADQIDHLATQLRQAQDRIAQLLPLEVSPKVQLRALRRTLPQTARRRLGRVRGAITNRSATGPGTPTPSQAPEDLDVTAALATSASLGRIFADLGVEASDVDFDAPTGALRMTSPSPPVPAVKATEPSPSTHPPATLHRPGDTPSTGDARGFLATTGADLLTFDIWDTLIERDRPADAAKTATARRMALMPDQIPDAVSHTPFTILGLRTRVEAELAATHPGQEYLIEDVLNRTLEELGVPAGRFCRDLAAELTELEVADEIRWSRPRGWVCDLAAASDSTTVLVSDFYMSQRHLTRIVHEVTGQRHDVVVSVDRGISKRVDGRLLEAVRGEREVGPARHVHVGDNPHSDVAEQVRTGGIAIQVPRDDRFAAPGSFTSDNLDECWAALQLDLSRLADSTTDPARIAGQRLAPLAVLLTARGIEEAYRTGTDRVHYASREGLFLSRVHERVQETLRVPRNDAVRAVHLEMSRRSTFGPSLEAPFHVSLHRMWSMYAEQTVSAMLVSIGISPQDCGEDLAAVGLSADTHLSDASRDPRVTALLARPTFTALLQEHIRDSRRMLRDYVLGRTSLAEPFLMVDVGWRGTIQDNLTRALGLRSVTGFYLGLFPFLNAQPFGSRKVGIAFDGNLGDEFSFAEPPAAIERPWTPDVPSTVRYRRDGDAVVPVLEGEPGAVSSAIGSFQEGTLEAADLVAQWLVGMGLTVDLLKPQLATMARELWTAPPEGLADIWFDSDHDDSFGALNSVSFGKEHPGPDWLAGPLGAHLRQGMQSSGWPAGYLSWQPVHGLVELVRLWRENDRG